jgi:hypothetical protein
MLLIHGEVEVQFHAFFIMALNRSALCPNCFTPGKVLLVHTEVDDGGGHRVSLDTCRREKSLAGKSNQF